MRLRLAGGNGQQHCGRPPAACLASRGRPLPRAPHTPGPRHNGPPQRGLFRFCVCCAFFLFFVVCWFWLVLSYTILLSGDAVGISMPSSRVVFVVLAPPPRMFLGHVSRVGLTFLEALGCLCEPSPPFNFCRSRVGPPFPTPLSTEWLAPHPAVH